MNPKRRSSATGTPASSGAAEHRLAWSVRSGAVDDVLAMMDIRIAARRRRRRRIRVGAGLTAVLLLAFFAGSHRWGAPSPPSSAAPASAVVSLPERTVLSDGSIVELKPGARITPAFAAKTRRVILEEGEAHFQVTSNPRWPFVVVAGNVEFRAVGTAFAVHVARGAVELFVTEGRVAVDKPAATAAPPEAQSPSSSAAAGSFAAETSQTLALVAAGRRVTVSIGADATPVASPIVAVPAAEVGERLAWRVPRLEFAGTLLSDAIPLFNRYSAVRLKLGDAAVANLRLSGALRADNVDTLLRLLEESHGIRVEHRSADEIVLWQGKGGK